MDSELLAVFSDAEWAERKRQIDADEPEDNDKTVEAGLEAVFRWLERAGWPPVAPPSVRSTSQPFIPCRPPVRDPESVHGFQGTVSMHDPAGAGQVGDTERNRLWLTILATLRARCAGVLARTTRTKGASTTRSARSATKTSARRGSRWFTVSD